MNRMICYKEWLKTRWTLLGIVLVFAAFTTYSLLNLAKVVELRGGAVLWMALLTRDAILVEILRYLPVAAGILLALSQFYPEVTRKRLKLTLHLPYPQKKMLFMMSGYGIGILLVLFCLQAGVLSWVLHQWIVGEMIRHILLTMLVWYLAGLAAYIWTSAVCLEPTWKLRVVLLLILAALLRILFLTGQPEAYNTVLPLLLVYVLCGQVLIYAGVARFKEGVQD